MFYELVKFNGQRIFRPSTEHFGNEFFTNKYDCYRAHEIFISNLPNDLTEKELVPFLNKIGPIYQTRIPVTFTGLNKGKAYAIFDNIQNAYKAVEELNGQLIRPNCPPVKVVFSANNCRLHLFFLSCDKDKEEIVKQINFVKGFKDIKLFKSKEEWHNEAIVTFDNHQNAANARRLFISGLIKINSGQLNVRADWAKPKDFQTLFFEHNNYLDETMVKEFLSAYSVKIRNVQIYGPKQIFVKFSSFAEANMVLKDLSDKVPFKIENALVYKVEWPIRS